MNAILAVRSSVYFDTVARVPAGRSATVQTRSHIEQRISAMAAIAPAQRTTVVATRLAMLNMPLLIASQSSTAFRQRVRRSDRSFVPMPTYARLTFWVDFRLLMPVMYAAVREKHHHSKTSSDPRLHTLP